MATRRGAVPSPASRGRPQRTVGVPSSVGPSPSSNGGMSTLDKLAEIRVMELKQFTLPSICDYLKNEHGFDISVDELADRALQLPVGNYAPALAKASTARSSKVEIDEKNGCQFILKNSKTRPNMPCGKKANANFYFCKACVKKKSFNDIARESAARLGLSFDEVIVDITLETTPTASSGPKRAPGRGPAQAPRAPSGAQIQRVPRAPGLGNVAPGAPPSRRNPYGASAGRGTPPPPPPAESGEEELELLEIEGLENICYEPNSYLVFHDKNDETVAFGIYDAKDDKIYPMEQTDRVKAMDMGFEIGKYDDYELGDRRGVEKDEDMAEEPAEEEE